MSLRINHNIASINGHRNLLKNSSMLQSSLEKLSSGLRINKAADDAAGLVISEQMRAQITGLNQAVSNSETAVSMVQTAEGALDEINSLLNKARQLTLHAANEGANDSTQLKADQTELDNVIQSIDRISTFTQFGTKKLLDGSLNGATTLSSGLSRVNVGNLANNTAVNTGAFSLAVSGAVYEKISVNGAGAKDTGNWVFSAGTISAVSGIATGASVNCGATMTVTIGGTNYVATGITGDLAVSGLVAQVNSKISGAGASYQVNQVAGGGLEIQRTSITTTDISGSITFARASGGNVASEASTLSVVTGTTATAAGALFNASTLSGIGSGSTFNGSGVAHVNLLTSSGGVKVLNVNISGGTTVWSGMNAVLTGIQGLAGLTGASLSLSSSATGLTFTLAAATGDSVSSFNFSMSLDNTNTLTQVPEVYTASGFSAVNSAVACGLFALTGVSGVSTATTFANAAVFTITVMGRAFSQSISGGGSVATLNTNLQTQIDNAVTAGTISGTYTLKFLAAGTVFTGSVAAATGLSGLNSTGTTNTGGYWALLRTDNVSQTDLGFGMQIDVITMSGSDPLAVSGVEKQVGVAADDTFNLQTTSQTKTTGVTLTAAVSMANTGTTITQSGTTSVSATLTSTDNTGLSLTLSSTGSNVTPSGTNGATLVLTSATGNTGFQDIEIEVNGTTASSSSSTLTFTLTNGAEFQVGANAAQTAGVTIGSVATTEMGRNVSGAGTLTSLNDLLSTNKNALATGLTDSALKVIDAAIDKVTNMRGALGAFQANTLESGLNSLRVSQENLTAAESTIRDVDFAAESANYTRNTILVQSATAMLAQANQLPQNVLKLLG